MSDFLPHPFWNFSLEIYAGEGVAEACLDLQARRGCDVNILLFCSWLGASGRPTLTAERLGAILKVSDVWQAEIVRPLRQVRQLLKELPFGHADVKDVRDPFVNPLARLACLADTIDLEDRLEDQRVVPVTSTRPPDG